MEETPYQFQHSYSALISTDAKMTPIKQTIFDYKKGNCFAASIASILDVALESVPNFCSDPTTYQPDGLEEDWYRRAQLWLKGQGWIMISFDWGEMPKGFIIPDGVWAIVGGPSPRNKEKLHAVIGRITSRYFFYVDKPAHQFSVDFVHDPHPDNTFVTEIADVNLLIKVA